MIVDPITLPLTATYGDAEALMKEYRISGRAHHPSRRHAGRHRHQPRHPLRDRLSASPSRSS